MEAQYIISEIRNIPIPTRKQAVAELVSETIMDYGREIKPAIEEHLVKRTYQIITQPKYKCWQWREIVTAFERGKRGDFGGESRISVSNIERWMFNYGNERSRKIVEQNIKEAYAQKQTVVEMTTNRRYAAMFQQLMTDRLKKAKKKEDWDDVPSLKDVMSDLGEERSAV